MVQTLTAATKQITAEKRKDVVEKLSRIEGRIKGLTRMVDEERTNTEILMQISATMEALRVVGKSFVQGCIEYHVDTGLNAINKERRESSYQELMDIIYRYVK
jgi:CsoR family transcriptional regulator, copper-sensing transcriptional repressor